MTTLPTVTRKQTGKTFRYEVDGEVHTGRSTRRYTHASAYVRTAVSRWGARNGEQVGDVSVWLHAREDLAVKGSPDANRMDHYRRIPGAIEIEEV